MQSKDTPTSAAISSSSGIEDVSEILGIAEACKLLKVHRNTLYKLINDGQMPAFRMMQGGRWRFRKSELEQWLEDCQARRRL